MNRVIFNAYQNACDCIYYGYGKSYWNDCGLDNESIANQVWKAAKNDLASNDTNRPYDEPSVETKKTLEKLSKEYENVSDSRNVKDDLDEDMKLWEERSKDEFGKVLKEIEKYCIDLWGLTNDYEVEGLEQSIISKYINTYALDGDRNYVARRIYRTLENFDMIDNNDDPRFMELVNEMLELGGVNNISDSQKVSDAKTDLSSFIKATKSGDYDINCTLYTKDFVPIAEYSQTWSVPINELKIDDFFKSYKDFENQYSNELNKRDKHLESASYALVFTTPSWKRKVFNSIGTIASVRADKLDSFDSFWKNKDNVEKYNASFYEDYAGLVVAFGDSQVSDSQKINDTDDEYLLQEIARQLEEGYHAGYEPQWDIDITVDGMDISEFDDYDQDLIYRDIAYAVKDGYDNYMGFETELSDGSIVYVDFVLNY